MEDCWAFLFMGRIVAAKSKQQIGIWTGCDSGLVHVTWGSGVREPNDVANRPSRRWPGSLIQLREMLLTSPSNWKLSKLLIRWFFIATRVGKFEGSIRPGLYV